MFEEDRSQVTGPSPCCDGGQIGNGLGPVQSNRAEEPVQRGAVEGQQGSVPQVAVDSGGHQPLFSFVLV